MFYVAIFIPEMDKYFKRRKIRISSYFKTSAYTWKVLSNMLGRFWTNEVSIFDYEKSQH